MPPPPLDETIDEGQLGHIGDHEYIAEQINALFLGGTFADWVLRKTGPTTYTLWERATGDVTTDDDAGVLFRQATDSLDEAGGGRIFVGPGNFTGALGESPDNANYRAVFYVGGYTTVEGSGEGVTVFQLPLDSLGVVEGTQVACMMNMHVATGDTNITLKSFTVDGRGDEQDVGVQAGIWMRNTTGTYAHRVTSKNFRGLATSGTDETGQWEIHASYDVTLDDCKAICDAGSTSTGFGIGSSTLVRLNSCLAAGMTVASGYSDHGCSSVYYTSCAAVSNALHGFNTELGLDIRWTNCTAGVRTHSVDGSAPFPYPVDTNLGNTGHGICINGATEFVVNGCVTAYGGQSGIVAISLGATASTGVIDGGISHNNDDWGIYIDDDSLPGVRILTRPRMHDNDIADLGIDGFGNTTIPNPNVQPNVPLTTVALLNPYAIDATAYVAGGTVTAIAVAGRTTGVTSGPIRVPAGSSIALTYSSPPTWAWVTD